MNPVVDIDTWAKGRIRRIIQSHKSGEITSLELLDAVHNLANQKMEYTEIMVKSKIEINLPIGKRTVIPMGYFLDQQDRLNMYFCLRKNGNRYEVLMEK